MSKLRFGHFLFGPFSPGVARRPKIGLPMDSSPRLTPGHRLYSRPCLGTLEAGLCLGFLVSGAPRGLRFPAAATTLFGIFGGKTPPIWYFWQQQPPCLGFLAAAPLLFRITGGSSSPVRDF